MGQAASEVRREIDEQRDELGENLQRLESKVKRTTDWRAQFDERPMMMIGVAFGGGLLLSSLAGGGGKDHGQPEPRRFSDPESMHTSHPSPERNEISETIDNIRGALMGLAARELRSFMAAAVPGFDQEYRETTDRRHASPATRLDDSEQMMHTPAVP
jgi:hypothetical protein